MDEDYGEQCEQYVPIGDDDEYGRWPNEDGMGYCGGTPKFISGHGYYNGQYDCYRMSLECDRCGTYDVECV